jgi:hypothetical protein
MAGVDQMCNMMANNKVAADAGLKFDYCTETGGLPAEAFRCADNSKPVTTGLDSTFSYNNVAKCVDCATCSASARRLSRRRLSSDVTITNNPVFKVSTSLASDSSMATANTAFSTLKSSLESDATRTAIQTQQAALVTEVKQVLAGDVAPSAMSAVLMAGLASMPKVAPTTTGGAATAVSLEQAIGDHSGAAATSLDTFALGSTPLPDAVKTATASMTASTKSIAPTVQASAPVAVQASTSTSGAAEMFVSVAALVGAAMLW